MIVNTGNTLQLTQPGQRLSVRIQDALDSWLSHNPHKSLNDLPDFVSPVSTGTTTPTTNNSHSNSNSKALDITAKLFLPINTTADEAVSVFSQVLDLCKKLDHCSIKYFILSLEGLTFSDSDKDRWNNDAIIEIWNKLISSPLKDQAVQNFGIAECSADRLTQLIESTPTIPKVDQINATECCALPPGLILLAKQNGIKLLAHHDPEDILSSDELQKVVHRTDAKWTWILRLTSIAEDRQVLVGNESFVCIV